MEKYLFNIFRSMVNSNACYIRKMLKLTILWNVVFQKSKTLTWNLYGEVMYRYSSIYLPYFEKKISTSKFLYFSLLNCTLLLTLGVLSISVFKCTLASTCQQYLVYVTSKHILCYPIHETKCIHETPIRYW